ncbi:MAG: response regulator [Candidatus Promineifilaceae bacterium]
MGTVILVDDDRTNATLIRTLLEMDGFRVVVCPTVSSAVLTSDEGVDAFIIDCHLSGEDDGIELLRAIREGRTGASADVAVIMTSGDDRRRGEAQSAGASYFLLKPYSPSELSRQLTVIVE